MPLKQPIVKLFSLILYSYANPVTIVNGTTLVKMMAAARFELIILFIGIYPLMSHVALYELTKIKTIQQKWCYSSLLLNDYYYHTHFFSTER